MKERRGLCNRALAFLLESVPGVNFLYSVIFYEGNVDFAAIDGIVRLLAMVDAMVLAGVLSLVGSVSFDELTQADDRWTTPPAEDAPSSYYYSLWHSGDNPLVFAPSYTPSASLARLLSLASFSLLASLAALLLFSVDAGNKNQGTARAGLATGSAAQAQLVAWWRFARLSLVLAALLTGVGLLYTSFAFAATLAVKFPDHCDSPATYSKDLRCSLELSVLLNDALLVPVLASILLLGLATASYFWVGGSASRAYETVSLDEGDLYDLLCLALGEDGGAMDGRSLPGRRRRADKYMRLMVAQEIGFEDFKRLTSDEMRELGIDNVADRVRIRAKIGKLITR